jgi:hypothetical protein
MSTLNNSDEIMCYLNGRYGHEERGKFLLHSTKGDEIEQKTQNVKNCCLPSVDILLNDIIFFHHKIVDAINSKIIVLSFVGS